MRAVLRTQMLAALAVAGSLILAAGWASIAADDAPKSAPETSPIASTTKTNKGQKKAVFAKKAGDREARGCQGVPRTAKGCPQPRRQSRQQDDL